MPAAAPITTELGRTIQHIRDEHDLTQDEFADRVGISQATVSRAMAGEISARTALKIEREFDLLPRTITDHVTGPLSVVTSICRQPRTDAAHILQYAA